MKIAVLANTAWYLSNFRLALMLRLRDAGHEVVACSPPGEGVDRIEAAGVRHRAFALSGSGTHPLRELRSVRQLRALLREERAEVLLSSTPKGNLYGALARAGLECAQVPNVSGLGTAFIRRNWVTAVARLLYRATFRRMHRVFFENADDLRLFVEAGLVRPERAERIPGLGVDLARFASTPLPPPGSPSALSFLLVARLLGDKGVREFVAAARALRAEFPHARFRLLGPDASDNPSAIARDELEGWLREGVVDYLGYHGDVRPFVAEAACVVLPSYREGMPRSLLEAAAMGRPLVATDVPGCRDAVVDGVTGFLCAPRDARALQEALGRMAALSPEERAAMGGRARAHMEREFSEDAVIARYLDVVATLKAPPR